MYPYKIQNIQLIELIRRMCNYVDSRLMDHGFRVSRTVAHMLPALGVSDPIRRRDICLLALLHDIGAYKTEEIHRLIQFETSDVWEHSSYGYLFVKHFSPLAPIADGILYHHMPWKKLRKIQGLSPENARLGQIIYLADRLDIIQMVKPSLQENLAQLAQRKGSQFDPELMDLFLSVDWSACFEKDPLHDRAYIEMLTAAPFSKDEIRQYLYLIVSIIDFRSRHTVTHTLSAAHIAYSLAQYMGEDASACDTIAYGTLLHDLGKIAVPVHILESPGKLNEEDMNIMRSHASITDRILQGIVPDPVQKIASRHHEKLNGCGYPNGLSAKDLSTGERIAAVSDIASALTGTRSYKEAFSSEKVCAILNQMKQAGEIDPDITQCLLDHLEPILKSAELQCRPLITSLHALMQEYRNLISTGGLPDPSYS